MSSTSIVWWSRCMRFWLSLCGSRSFSYPLWYLFPCLFKLFCYISDFISSWYFKVRILIGQYKILPTAGSTCARTRYNIKHPTDGFLWNSLVCCVRSPGVCCSHLWGLYVTLLSHTRIIQPFFSLLSSILWKYNRYDLSDESQYDPIAIILLADLCDVTKMILLIQWGLIRNIRYGSAFSNAYSELNECQTQVESCWVSCNLSLSGFLQEPYKCNLPEDHTDHDKACWGICLYWHVSPYRWNCNEVLYHAA